MIGPSERKLPGFVSSLSSLWIQSRSWHLEEPIGMHFGIYPVEKSKNLIMLSKLMKTVVFQPLFQDLFQTLFQ